MTFLRLLSQKAYQNFTFTCVNAVAWYNQRTFNYDQAIKLLGDNEQEFSAKGVRPNVIIDGCKVTLTTPSGRKRNFFCHLAAGIGHFSCHLAAGISS
jgi:Fibrillar collagen C-terminal domain